MNENNSCNYLNALKYFITLADKGNTKKAAEELGISPSALLQYKRSLENSLDIKLFFNNQSTPLTLTPAGIRYYQYCKDSLELWDEYSKKLKNSRVQPITG